MREAASIFITIYLILMTYGVFWTVLENDNQKETFTEPIFTPTEYEYNDLLTSCNAEKTFRKPNEKSSPKCFHQTVAAAFIPSAIPHTERRRIIRNSWGHPTIVEITGLRPFFVLGKPVSQNVQPAIDEEQETYGDILQGDFIDVYDNLTLKTGFLLKKALQMCPDVEFVVKIDDDVIPDPFRLCCFLMTQLEFERPPKHILGKLRPHEEPLRSGKWGVSQQEYPNSFYPPYVAGPSYILPKSAVKPIYETSLKIKKLRLEDVFHTGLCAEVAGISHISTYSLTNSNPDTTHKDWILSSKIFQENLNIKQTVVAWNALLDFYNLTIS